MENDSPKLFNLKCMGCGEDFIGSEPDRCCDGYMCGCQGQPISPIVCSEKCYDAVLNRRIVWEKLNGE